MPREIPKKAGLSITAVAEAVSLAAEVAIVAFPNGALLLTELEAVNEAALVPKEDALVDTVKEVKLFTRGDGQTAVLIQTVV